MAALQLARLSALLVFVSVVPGSLARECSRLVSQLGDPTALELDGFQVYINFSEIDSASGFPDVDVIVASGEKVETNFSSTEAYQSELQLPTTTNMLPLHIKLGDLRNQTLYYALSVWSLNDSISPLAACPDPAESTISSGEDKTISIELACSGSGSVYMQGCLTVGDTPFSLLNGTYKTLTFYFQKACNGSSGLPLSCSVKTTEKVVPLELCISVEQARELVNSEEGSWSLLFSILTATTRGICLVDRFVAGGISQVLQDPTQSAGLPLPGSFKEIGMYYDHPSYMTSPVIYLLELTREDPEILGQPYHNETSPGIITAEQGQKGVTVTLPCVGPGTTRVFANLTSSGFIGGTLYTNSYTFGAYRNCPPNTNETVQVHTIESSSSNLLGVEVGVPVSVLVLLLVAAGFVIVTVLLTRNQRKRIEVSRESALQDLSINSAYLRGHFSVANAFEVLEEYNLEYNYVSIEVVEELGEGAFGRVFKA